MPWRRLLTIVSFVLIEIVNIAAGPAFDYCKVEFIIIAAVAAVDFCKFIIRKDNNVI